MKKNLSRIWASRFVLILNEVVLQLFLILTSVLEPHQKFHFY